MEYTIDFKKTYKPNAKSIEFGTTTVVICNMTTINRPVHFTFYENSNNNGKITGTTGTIEITVNVGDATIEELVDAYFHLRSINGCQWKPSNLY